MYTEIGHRMETQPPAQTYGQKLRYERKLRGLTRDELAEMLDVFKIYIGKWEREETLPYPSDQQKLCKLFGKTVQELGLASAVSSKVPLTSSPNRNAHELRNER
jgi:transcriptional regulator with XRE-family HTH domain